MTTVCLVTNELFPFKPGGIGRLMYNFALHNKRQRHAVHLHFLMPHAPTAERDAIRESLASLGEVHFCPEKIDRFDGTPWVFRKDRGYDALDEHMGSSLLYYLGLLEAERSIGRPFDIVEFPDFGGWGAASIAAKRGGLAFENTLISVRLHSTFGIIASHEPFYHQPSHWMAAIADLERTALADADLVVGHLDSIADENQRHYAFSDEWRQRVHIEFPPILTDGLEIAKTKDDHWRRMAGKATSRQDTQDFVFSSRLQPFKRPDLFIRAAVVFLRENPHAPSQFRLVSYGWDEKYINWLRRLVPPGMDDRITFVQGATQERRAEIIANSIVVVPSDYESLCLFAYEGSILGSRVILNRACTAFGSSDRWREGDNCLMFDGSYRDLAAAMRRALDWQAAEAVDVTPDDAYWVNWEKPERKPEAPELQVDLVALGARTLAELNAAFFGSLDLGVDAFATLPRPVLEHARRHVSDFQGIGICLTEWLQPTATEIQAFLSGLSSDLVLLAKHDALPEKAFIAAAARAFQRDPTLSAVTSHSALRNDDGRVTGIRLYPGGLPTLAKTAAPIAHDATVFRRSDIIEMGLREAAQDRWKDDLLARMVTTGRRVLCLPMVGTTEPWHPAKTNMRDDLFEAQVRDEFGQEAGLAERVGSIPFSGPAYLDYVHPADTEQHPPEVRHMVLSWQRAEIKENSDSPDYSEIEVTFEEVIYRRVGYPWIFLKLIVYKGHPQLQLRDMLHHPLQAWPPKSRDEWGHVLVYTPQDGDARSSEACQEMLALPDEDRETVAALLDGAKKAIKTSGRLSEEREQFWVSSARELADRWREEEPVVPTIAGGEHVDTGTIVSSSEARRPAPSGDGLRFSSGAVNEHQGQAGDVYRHLSIGLDDVSIDGRSFPWVAFKLAEFKGAPQIEFREQPRGFFESWPPPTSDQWGPFVEFCPDAAPEKRNAAAQAIDALSEGDRRRLDVFMRELPAIVAAATSGRDQADWLAAAQRLADCWIDPSLSASSEGDAAEAAQAQHSTASTSSVQQGGFSAFRRLRRKLGGQ